MLIRREEIIGEVPTALQDEKFDATVRKMTAQEPIVVVEEAPQSPS